MTTATFSAAKATVLTEQDWFSRHWFVLFAAVYGLWVWLPFLAPLLMHAGWAPAARAIYFFYSLFCHQLPERSFFLFGRMPMYSLADLQAAGQHSINPFVLRQFVGDESMGWKVAWSDRMISFYMSIWLFVVPWWLFGRKMRSLPWWGLLLLLLPIVLDGGTHAVSDLAGIGRGFRDTNQWLVMLTNNSLPTRFYAGDLLGTLNSWMRLVTGILAGLGIAWFIFPRLEASFAQD
jgi:uncharacterized membrane protein